MVNGHWSVLLRVITCRFSILLEQAMALNVQTQKQRMTDDR